MHTPGRISVQVNGQDFEIQWQDHGANRRLVVFQNGKRLGHKVLPWAVDDGVGVVEYAVKSLVMKQPKTEISVTV